MGGLRKLRRKRRSAKYDVEPLRPAGNLHLRKMSEVLIDFAQPLLNEIDDDELFGRAVSFAAICWNLSFMPENEHQKFIRRMVRGFGKFGVFERLQMENWAHMLLERKKAFFAHDRRMLMDYKIIEEEHSHRLLTMSALADSDIGETQ
jgi:hypothetical protein